MGILATDRFTADVLYLCRQDVIECCEEIDVVSTVVETLERHARGETVLSDEAYLGWTVDGAPARSLAMSGSITANGHPVIGVKVINGSLANPDQGIPRSQGFTMTLDPETARPVAILEAAYISALRTAAVTAASARCLGLPKLSTAGLVGCGTLAKAHLSVLPRALPSLRHILLHDRDFARARSLAAALRADETAAHLDVRVVADVEECVRASELLVTLTTVTEGYIPYEWIRPGVLIAHVSLDDVLPEVVEQADLVLVDDWKLVSGDDRRLLGRLYRDGRLRAPDGSYCPGCEGAAGARRVDGTLGEALLFPERGRRSERDVILSNPFGMAILDVAVGAKVTARAIAEQRGRRLPL